MDLNRASILGRITQDPEVRSTSTGQAVTNMSVATNRVWTDKSGVKQEKAEFHNIVLWGKLGEIAGQYLSKGRRVFVEGRLETRDWTGTDGVKRYRTEIIADNLIMLDSPRGNSDMGSSTKGSVKSASDDMPVMPESDDEIKVEDIPF